MHDDLPYPNTIMRGWSSQVPRSSSLLRGNYFFLLIYSYSDVTECSLKNLVLFYPRPFYTRVLAVFISWTLSTSEVEYL